MARRAGSDGETTRAAIRANATRLFASLGYNAVSMRMIADAVGVQPAALYQHHASKQHLLAGLMRAHMAQLLEAWRAEDRPAGDPAAELEHFARFHIRYHLKRPDEVFISYMELRSLEADNLAGISALRGDYEGVLKDILRRGVDSGAFLLEDAHVAAMAILAMLTGVNTWYRGGGRLSEARIETIYVSLVLGSVGRGREEERDV